MIIEDDKLEYTDIKEVRGIHEEVWENKQTLVRCKHVGLIIFGVFSVIMALLELMARYTATVVDGNGLPVVQDVMMVAYFTYIILTLLEYVYLGARNRRIAERELFQNNLEKVVTDKDMLTKSPIELENELHSRLYFQGLEDRELAHLIQARNGIVM